MDYYPQNTVAQYTTKVTSPVELDGEWDVGLTEIPFPFDIQNVTKGCCYFYISQIGFTCSTKITLPDRHYRRLQEINQHMKVSTMLQLRLSSIEKAPINFSFSRQHNQVRMNLTENATVEFGVVLARLLGFRHGITYYNASVLGD